MSDDTAGAVWGLGGMALLIIVFALVLWAGVAVWRAKAALGREQEYRRLADRATAAQEETARRLDELDAQLASVRRRLETIEVILKEVE
ncbi:hypothetical protein [Actinomadura rubrisoli]|uniref:Uncharacterized protein n=1 Tax=Actinomadura rubrisoli TaxID=2530368 RepID=A0A4R5AJ31_9ACTN|nr:hypothetical protein [Actinomadura rubrisoli]TDD71466.1 hypothetical protein E1298_35770 [Actinomadura rubrisoli]